MVEKLNRILVEEKLKSIGLLIFSPREFRDIFNVSTKTASIFISRNLKSGLFLKLRNGFYALKDSDISAYAVANRMYQPSYISLEKALSHYRLIPEIVYTITSVTTKPTAEFKTPKGIFTYQKIKKDAFTGYGPKQISGETILIAEPEKALADYLYFVDLKKISLNERLSLRGIKRNELIKFAKMFGRSSLLILINHIYAEYKKHPTIH